MTCMKHSEKSLIYCCKLKGLLLGLESLRFIVVLPRYIEKSKALFSSLFRQVKVLLNFFVH